MPLLTVGTMMPYEVDYPLPNFLSLYLSDKGVVGFVLYESLWLELRWNCHVLTLNFKSRKFVNAPV